MPDWADFPDEGEQVLGGRPVAADRLDGRPANMLVVVEPPLPQVRNRDRLEAQGRRRPHLQLAVDLGGHLPGQVPVRADPRPAPLAGLEVVQIPDLGRGGRRGPCPPETTACCAPFRVLPRESSRYKTPQKPPQTGRFWGDPRNATALESRTYDSRAAGRAERTGNCFRLCAILAAKLAFRR